MSSEARLDLLQTSVLELCRAVDSLSARLDYLENRSGVHAFHWVAVSQSRPAVIGYCPHNIPNHRFQEAEEGPPPFPEALIEFCGGLAEGPGVEIRAKRAWQSGFWANISIVTDTTFAGQDPIRVEDQYWLVLRAKGTSCPYLVHSEEEVRLLLLLPGNKVGPVILGFPTLTEVEICCAGGNFPVPQVVKWTRL